MVRKKTAEARKVEPAAPVGEPTIVDDAGPCTVPGCSGRRMKLPGPPHLVRNEEGLVMQRVPTWRQPHSLYCQACDERTATAPTRLLERLWFAEPETVGAVSAEITRWLEETRI